MNKFNSNELIGIRQANSVDFVKLAFQTYNSGNVLVILKQPDVGLHLREEITPQAGGGWLKLKQDVIQENRPAQIVFTSGTEGAPKAILLSHRALADVVIRLNKIMRVDETISEYVGIPVTYSFGFGRCRAVAAAGGRCFIPENGFNPLEIARMLAADEINAISAVPTLWRTLLAQSELIGALGKKVKWIEIGSQYMSREEKEQMKLLFPNAVIVQHYGLTEASRTTFLNISETEGDALESVGQAFGDVEVKISPAGLIMIRGPHVATGQIVGQEIKGLVDADGWYTTGDFGRLEKNFLYYEGRADDLINCAGIKINPDLLQERINRFLNSGNKVAVCRIDDKLRGDGFFVAVETGSGLNLAEAQEITANELLAMGVNARSSVKVQEVTNIPRTDTGKVRRKELAKLYAKTTAEGISQSAGEENGSILDLYASTFPGVDIKPQDTFRSLGGDSLNYIQMLMLLEARLGFAPNDWDKMPIGHLEKIEKKKTSPLISWVDTSIFLRVLAIMGVVATHSGGSWFGGGTLLLFALIGYNMARFKSADFFEGNFWGWFKPYSVIILIPYFILTAMYLGANKVFEVDRVLLYGNIVNATLTTLFPFWFVQVLLQCLIVAGMIFSIPYLRQQASKSPVVFSLSVLACFVAVRMAYPVLWDTAYHNGLISYAANDMLPFRFMAILWLGWTFYFVHGFQQKLLMCAIGVIFAFIDIGFFVGFDFSSPQAGLAGPIKWLALGSVFLAFVPRVPIFSFTKRIFNDIGAATFHIFIFNGLLIKLIEKIFHTESVAVIFCFTMTGSMLIWWIMENLRIIPRMQALINFRGMKKA